jgi:hypothetical protein
MIQQKVTTKVKVKGEKGECEEDLVELAREDTEKLYLDEHVYRQLDSLVMVPGHAIYLGNSVDQVKSPIAWTGTFPGYLGADEVRPYAEHVERGVRLAKENVKALLVFSGGQTREEAGPMSEALGYWRLADQYAWFSCSDVRQRATTEEFARDSFENLLFSIYSFWQCTKNWPKTVHVRGYGFKGKRFGGNAAVDEELTRFGIGQKFEFHYEAVNEPPYYVLEGPNGSRVGEARTAAEFSDVNHPKLQVKRRDRDPFMRGNPYIPLRDPRASHTF